MRDIYLPRIVLMLFLLPAATFTVAQFTPVDFLSPGKTWTEGYNWCSFEGDCNTWSFRYKFDTLTVNIGAQTYFSLFKADTEFSEVWTDEGSLIREVDGRIYLYQSNGEQLIYDFNLIEGDTFHFMETPSYYNFVVETVDTVTLLDGQFRKHWALRPITGHDPVPEDLWIHWIEGIGNLDGLFTNGLPWTSDAAWSTVLCVYASGTILYDNPDYDMCWLMTTGTAEIKQDAIAVDPNPATDHITIRNLENGFQIIHILDSYGRLMCTSNDQFVVLNDLPSGLYYAIVLLNNNSVRKLRFAKI